jgi:hypothetical protein
VWNAQVYYTEDPKGPKKAEEKGRVKYTEIITCTPLDLKENPMVIVSTPGRVHKFQAENAGLLLGTCVCTSTARVLHSFWIGKSPPAPNIRCGPPPPPPPPPPPHPPGGGGGGGPKSEGGVGVRWERR